MTDLEKAMGKILGELGYRVLYQHELRPYIVDFFLPDFNIIVEADGEIWHSNMKDRERDLELKERYGTRVLHFLGSSILRSPERVGDSIREEAEGKSYLPESHYFKPEITD